jgi:GxxExxY protein
METLLTERIGQHLLFPNLTMTENEISYLIRKGIFMVYNRLGPGLLESTYEASLAYELQKLGLKVSLQVPIPMVYEEVRLNIGFRVDMIVEDKVMVEIKSIEGLADVHHQQLLTYLKLSKLRLGLLVNFNTTEITNSIICKVNGL